jgi:phosphoadenosine phosphosulfate reductase
LKREPAAPAELARELASSHRGASAEDILSTALDRVFAGRIALVSSFGAESVVLLHLLASVDRSAPVLFIETGKHFAQTLSYRRRLAHQLGLTNVRDLRPNKEEVEEEDAAGDLWRRDPDACCELRKIRPLGDALDGYDAWITGRKAFHGGGRISLPAFEWNGTHHKVNPLVRWSREDVASYIEHHDLPRHPLTAQGYPSIGCWPCTRPADEGDDIRAGRWAGSDKRECGIHDR